MALPVNYKQIAVASPAPMTSNRFNLLAKGAMAIVPINTVVQKLV